MFRYILLAYFLSFVNTFLGLLLSRAVTTHSYLLIYQGETVCSYLLLRYTLLRDASKRGTRSEETRVSARVATGVGAPGSDAARSSVCYRDAFIFKAHVDPSVSLSLGSNRFSIPYSVGDTCHERASERAPRSGRRPRGISKEIVCRPRTGAYFVFLLFGTACVAMRGVVAAAVAVVLAPRRIRVPQFFPQFSRRNKAPIGDLPIVATWRDDISEDVRSVRPRFRRADSRALFLDIPRTTTALFYPAISLPVLNTSRLDRFRVFSFSRDFHAGDASEQAHARGRESISTFEFRHTELSG